jgi:hypothetical protein
MSSGTIILILFIVVILIGMGFLVYYIYKKKKTNPTGPTGNYPKFTLSNYTTSVSDSGNFLYYLDRQNVQCGTGSVLSRVVLNGTGSTGMYYDYVCASAIDLTDKGVVGETKSTQDYFISVTGLYPQIVDCPVGSALSQFHFVSLSPTGTSPQQLYYQKTCRTVPGLSATGITATICVDKTTISNPNVSGVTGAVASSLFGLDISCPDNYVLTSFQLVASGPSSSQYKYTCCTR